MATRVPTRRGIQNRQTNENATGTKHVRSGSTTGPSRVPKPAATSTTRLALGELTKLSQNRSKPPSKRPVIGKGAPVEEKEEFIEGSLKRNRPASVAAALGPQRVPIGPGRVAPPTVNPVNARVNPAPTRTFRFPVFTSNKQQNDVVQKEEVHEVPIPRSDDMDVEAEVHAPAVPVHEDDEMSAPPEKIMEEMLAEMENEHDMFKSEGPSSPHYEESEIDESEARKEAMAEWPDMSSKYMLQQRARVDEIRETFIDEADVMDPTMVSEYAEEIFEYMEELEEEMMPNPNYMAQQSDITWPMRQTLVDWLLQVHIRYHMLPETLWIAINIVDRFLSKRVVSLIKLQLVGVTAMFIASKYEEILAPSIDEFVFMTDNGYTKAEILKGERIVLATLDFKVSTYCSPYSWMRRISKADDYDLQTRTLGKFLSEVMLLDYRFLGAKPSLLAAVSMYTARRMLGQDWNEAFIVYSGFTEDQVRPGHAMLVEKLREPTFPRLYVYKKYSHKKFLKASSFAVEWADGHSEDLCEDPRE
jgi:hypothetical protein